MAKPLVSDELWEILQPLLPSPNPGGSAIRDANLWMTAKP